MGLLLFLPPDCIPRLNSKWGVCVFNLPSLSGHLKNLPLFIYQWGKFQVGKESI